MVRMTSFWVLCFSLAVFAQLPLQTSLTLNNVDGGRSIALLGDVNGDGIGDYVHGPATLSSLPLRVRSGLDSSLIYSVPLPPGGTSFGAELTTIGDVDADGVRDFVSLRGEGVAMAAYSGATGALLNHVSQVPGAPLFGLQAIVVGDLDSDMIPEVAATWVSPFFGPALIGFGIYSGVDGSPIRFFTENGSYLKVTALTDVNADGLPDLAVIFGDNIATPMVDRSLRILSGADGSVLFSTDTPIVPEQLTQAVALGDVNDDGFGDYALTYIDTNYMWTPRYSLIKAFSGQDGSSLWSYASPLDHYVGKEVTPSADVNGDGILDVIAVDEDFTSLPNPFRIVALSGLDGSLIGSYRPSYNYVQRLDLDAGEDVNGDGIVDLAYVVWDDLGAHVGVFSMTGAASYGSGLGGSQTLGLLWQPDSTTEPHEGQVVVTGAPAFATGQIFATSALGNSTIAGLPILLDLDPANLVFQSTLTYNALGELAAAIDLKNPFLAGTSVYLQSFSLSPQLACSNGLQLLFSH